MADPTILNGEYRSPGRLSDVIGAAVLFLFSLPWLIMAVLLIFTGARSIADPRFGDDLSICLWAGLALISVYLFAVYVLFWRMPRQRIFRFELTADELICSTHGDGLLHLPRTQFQSLVSIRGRRAPMRGWWLKFRDSRWLLLEKTTSNAGPLVIALDANAETA